MVPLTDHQGGSQQLLVGDDKDVPTLDLRLGDLLKGASPFASVELGIQSRISKGGTPTVPHPHFVRTSLAHEIFAEDNPLAAFGSLFGSGAGATSSSASIANAMLLAKQKKSVLDATAGDLASLAKALPGSERSKIDFYTDAVRTLEMRLTMPTDAATSATCSDLSGFNPTKFTVPPFTDPNQASYQQTANQPVVADLQMEIARLALACGRTQVVTLLFGHTNAHNPIQGLGTIGVHDASHNNMAAFRIYRVWYAQRLAQFIAMMKATPDVTGSLFDNTMIFHCSELGDGGPHKTDRVPFVFIGGGALGFKLGQAINFNGTVPAYTSGAHSGQRYMSHSPLLTIIAKKMGMPLPAGSFVGYSGPQALDPLSLGII